MNCHIIFYMAKKTGLCEKAFKTFGKNNELTIEKTFFATTPLQFGKNIVDSLSKVNLVFIVGGFGISDDISTETILSNALSHNLPSEVKKLKNPKSDKDGYLIRQDNQLIIALPDEPKVISSLLDNNIKEYIENYCYIM